ncbi:MAG: ABC transporter permease [Acidimicrobiia bacterium]|nr:ABC transporter permease [Acidimicrobiia bacterium]
MTAPPRAQVAAAIVGTELRRVSRDRTGLFFIVVLPVVIIIVIGATIGAAPGALPLGVLDADRSAASEALVAALDADPAVDLQRFDDLEDLRQQVRTATVVGGLEIPEGFGADLGAGEQVELSLQSGDPQTGQAAAEVVSAITDELGSRLQAASVLVDGLGLAEDDAEQLVSRTAGDLVAVEVTLETVGEAATLTGENQYAYTAPSNLVLFVFINSLAVGGVLIETRRLGVARRMMAAPITVGTILVGTGATRFLFALLQSVLIVAVGRLLFDVRWGETVAVAALVVAFSLVGTGAGLLVGAVARNAEQAQSIGIPVAVALAMLGGCMWPLEIVPPAMVVIGHLTPHAWAMNGWIALIFEGGGLRDIALELGVLVAYGGALVVVAMLVLRRRLLAGT